MNLREWIVTLVTGKPPAEHTPDPVKVRLSERQADVASRLAQMQGKTRDEVLAEAYRRADRLVARRR